MATEAEQVQQIFGMPLNDAAKCVERRTPTTHMARDIIPLVRRAGLFEERMSTDVS
jgi:hypothetical protein